MSEKDFVPPPFMSGNTQNVFTKTAKASIMNPRAPVPENQRSVCFENNCFPLGSKNCAFRVVKTVSSGTILQSNASLIKDSVCFIPSKPKLISCESVYCEPSDFVADA